MRTRTHARTPAAINYYYTCMSNTARAFNYILITKSSLSIKFLIKSQEFHLLSPGGFGTHPAAASQASSTLHMANNRLKAGFFSTLECNNYTTEWLFIPR